VLTRLTLQLGPDCRGRHLEQRAADGDRQGRHIEGGRIAGPGRPQQIGNAADAGCDGQHQNEKRPGEHGDLAATSPCAGKRMRSHAAAGSKRITASSIARVA
jgi:hypothetical protein